MALFPRRAHSMVRTGAILSIATTLLMATPLATRAATRHVGTTATVPARSLVALQMFTTESGVALAQIPPATARHRNYRYDVVRTRNGGVSWTITGSVPPILTPSTQSADLDLLLRWPSQRH
jgi:hypothetical protein